MRAGEPLRTRVVLLAGRDLLEDLVTVGAPEHRELPHHPVPVVVEARAVRRLLLRERALGAVELEAGGEALAEHVADLLLDVVVGQGREVREGLELEGRLPHLLWREQGETPGCWGTIATVSQFVATVRVSMGHEREFASPFPQCQPDDTRIALSIAL